MDFGKAFTYMFQDPNWLAKLGIGNTLDTGWHLFAAGAHRHRAVDYRVRLLPGRARQRPTRPRASAAPSGKTGVGSSCWG